MSILRHPWKNSRVSEILGTRYPIIQGPFGGLSSVRLAAEVSNAGGMGSFGAQPLSPAQIKETVSEIRSLTSNPFSINLWVSTFDKSAASISRERISESAAALHRYFGELGVTIPPVPEFKPQDFEAQASALLEARPPVASFVFGVPPADLLTECRRKGIRTIGTATTADEAKALEVAGLDMVVASSLEAGGHRGSFLASSEASLTGLIALVPQIADRVSIPVIAAGGIADGRGIVAALALGAEAVQIGTAFLVCKNSGISDLHRKTLLSDSAKFTGLTKAFSGRLARGIRNRLLEDMEEFEPKPLPYPVQRALLSPYTEAALGQKRSDLLPMWAGQAAPLIQHTEVNSLMKNLTEQTEAIYQRFASW